MIIATRIVFLSSPGNWKKKLGHFQSHVNIKSIKRNCDYKFGVIDIPETLLQEDTCDFYMLEGYKFVEKHRASRSGGRMGLFSNESISSY